MIPITTKKLAIHSFRWMGEIVINIDVVAQMKMNKMCDGIWGV